MRLIFFIVNYINSHGMYTLQIFLTWYLFHCITSTKQGEHIDIFAWQKERIRKSRENIFGNCARILTNCFLYGSLEMTLPYNGIYFIIYYIFYPLLSNSFIFSFLVILRSILLRSLFISPFLTLLYMSHVFFQFVFFHKHHFETHLTCIIYKQVLLTKHDTISLPSPFICIINA